MLNIPTFTPEDWYWQIGNHFWSSKHATYVDTLPMDASVSHIESEQELQRVLCEIGLGDQAPWSLEQLRERKVTEISTEAQQQANAYMAQYPEFERLTWDAQEREARAFLADDLTDTPTLSPIAQARGLSVVELAERVVNKADTFRAAAAQLAGTRQALEDQIMAAETIEQVRAVIWPE